MFKSFGRELKKERPRLSRCPSPVQAVDAIKQSSRGYGAVRSICVWKPAGGLRSDNGRAESKGSGGFRKNIVLNKGIKNANQNNFDRRSPACTDIFGHRKYREFFWIGKGKMDKFAEKLNFSSMKEEMCGRLFVVGP